MEQVQGLFSNKINVIWYTWLVTQVFKFAFVICVLAAAAKAESHAYGFALVWYALLAIALAVGGTMLLKNPAYRSEKWMGCMLGVCFCTAMQMLTVAVLSANNVGNPFESRPSAETATAVFAVFLFILYGVITAMLAVFGGELVQKDGLIPEGEGEAGSNGGGFMQSVVPSDEGSYDPSGMEEGDGGAVDVGAGEQSVL